MYFKKKVYLLSLTLLLLSEFLPDLKEQSVWQGLGMTSPGLQRGKEDSWRCPDWRGTGLPVVQIYRGDQAQVQHNALACLKRGGELRAGQSSSPICSSVLWQWFGLLHTPRLSNCPSSKPSYTVFFCLAFLGTALQAIRVIWEVLSVA